MQKMLLMQKNYSTSFLAFFNFLFLIDCEKPRTLITSVCLKCNKCRSLTQPVRVAFNSVIMYFNYSYIFFNFLGPQ